MNHIIVDPISATLCKVPPPSFETLKAVLSRIGEHFKLESEAEMCRWEDDGGAPYPSTK